MAILIEKDLNIMGGILVDQIYLRIQYTADLSGKYLVCNIFPYYDKNSFLSNHNMNVLSLNDFKTYHEFSYNPLEDGDPLLYIHDKLRNYLTTETYKKEIILDPSTGEPIRDPSTGEVEYTEVIDREKFAEEDELSFVDLD